jgi:uroporphyrinogen decarboxylase
MAKFHGLEKPYRPDWQGLVADILRKGTPRRVYFIELFHDAEIAEAIARRFGLLDGVRPDDADRDRKRLIAVNRFSGLDYVGVPLSNVAMPSFRTTVDDTAALARAGGRAFQDEHRGPIMTWEDFEKFPWPDPGAPEATQDLEWFSKNLPDDMCIFARGTAHFAEYLAWLMGYETLCFALYDNRGLVEALAARLRDFYRMVLGRLLQFDRVKVVFASDDMGFRTGPLISPADMREFVLSGHREQAAMAHAAGRPYILHSCGKLSGLMDDLTDDVKIDGKHSFEDTIEDVRQVKSTYGRKIALLGGIDVDFLCRSPESAIRRRVRETLAACLPGGGYCLGTGNSVTNYIPLDNYLAMIDEGRLYGT